MRFFGRKKYTSVTVRKKDLPGGLWTKCPACNEIVYKHEIESGKGVCPKCSFHFQMNWKDRLNLLTEENSFVEWDGDLISVDPLAFVDQLPYPERLEKNRKQTNMKEAVVCGRAKIGPFGVALGIMDFTFFGASMGSVVGEKITRLIERGTAAKLPVIIVCASGGARMQEGMFSLMQMVKTSAALARHGQAGLPYISVLTHPTTAGVMASFASLGDVIIAEPLAMIGFAGPRVIKETTREDVPKGFQRAEFVLARGLVDMIVHRMALKQTLINVLTYLSGEVSKPAVPAGQQEK